MNSHTNAAAPLGVASSIVKSILLLLVLLGFVACKRTNVVAPTLIATPAPLPPNLRFVSYDGDPTTTNLNKMLFQISSVDHRQPSEFLKLGEMVPNTRFRLSTFQYKTRRNPRTGEEEDASELTLINTETNQVVVLTTPKPIDSPPTF